MPMATPARIAYRGTDEVLGGWRERTFSDITYGEEQLAHHVEGYRPLAFAPPGGNYGQADTNDPRIPRLLLPRLELSFDLVFTRDGPGFATSGAPNPARPDRDHARGIGRAASSARRLRTRQTI